MKLLKLWRNNTFLAAIFKLSSGNILAQVLNIGTIPIITRFYSPESYGTYALVLSFVAFLAPVSCFSYQYAIVMVRSEKDADNILYLCLIMLTVFIAIIFGFYHLLGGQLLQFLSSANIQPYFYFFMGALALTGFYLIISSWFLRRKEYNLLALSRFYETAADRALVISCAFLGFLNISILLTGRIIGLVTVTVFLMSFIFLRNESGFAPLDKKIIISSMRKYKNLPFFFSSSNLMNDFSRLAPIVILTFFWGLNTAGLYALCERVLSAPMSILGDSIARVFFNDSCESVSKEENITGKVLSLFNFVLIISFCPLIMLGIVGDEFCQYFFGDKWSNAGYMIQIILFMSLTAFVSRPFYSLYNVFDKQKVLFIFDVSLCIVRIAILVLGGLFLTSAVTVFIFSAASSLIYLACMLWIFKYMDISIMNPIRIAGLHMAVSFPFFMLLLLIKANIALSNIILLVVLSLFVLTVYGIHYCIRKHRLASL